MKNILFLFFFLFFLTSCGDRDDYYERATAIEESYTAQETAPTAPEIVEAEITEKKIIKEGLMAIQVTSVKTAKSNMDALVRTHQGYYSQEDYQDSNYESTYLLSIRIPSQLYEDFISAIESDNGKILHKTIEARDVTEEFIDITTRLENKRVYLKHYREILKKAVTIKEILEVEQYIRGLEEEIESAEGRLRYLSDKVSYSTLKLSITQPKEYKPSVFPEDKFLYRLKSSFITGWDVFVELILMVVNLWPFAILLGICMFFWRKRKKRGKELQE